MCYAVYVGTNQLQETEGWINESTALYLRDVIEPGAMQGLKAKFTKRNIYYVGSYQGCSCGFAYEPRGSRAQGVDDIDDEERKMRKSAEALISLIDRLTKTEDVEFYCCWEGDWGDKFEEKERLDIRNVSVDHNYFALIEKRFLIFEQQDIR